MIEPTAVTFTVVDDQGVAVLYRDAEVEYLVEGLSITMTIKNYRDRYVAGQLPYDKD